MTNTNNMFKKLLIFILPLAFFFGCSRNPFNVSPPNQYSTGNYPKSIDGLNSVLSTAYSELRDDHLYGFTFLTKPMANITHSANSFYAGDASWNAMANMNLSPNNSYVSGVWAQLYKGVKNCNVALNAANFYMKNYAEPRDKQKVDYIRGQAYFLRGFYYFMLESLYGEQWILNLTPSDTLGVPLFTGLPKSLAASQKPRSSIKAVWSQVESDLKKASKLLDGKMWSGNNIGGLPHGRLKRF